MNDVEVFQIALPPHRSFLLPPSPSNPPLLSQQLSLARTPPFPALALPCLGPRNRDPFGLPSSILVSSVDQTFFTTYSWTDTVSSLLCSSPERVFLIVRRARTAWFAGLHNLPLLLPTRNDPGGQPQLTNAGFGKCGVLFSPSLPLRHST